MPVKRRFGKARQDAIGDEAIRLFEEMRQLGCSSPRPDYHSAIGDAECDGCTKFWELHTLLRRALNERMWRYPTISRWPPDDRRNWPDDSEQARYLRLERALEARRQRAQVTEPEVAA